MPMVDVSDELHRAVEVRLLIVIHRHVAAVRAAEMTLSLHERRHLPVHGEV